jgi:hypothetical protein
VPLRVITRGTSPLLALDSLVEHRPVVGGRVWVAALEVLHRRPHLFHHADQAMIPITLKRSRWRAWPKIGQSPQVKDLAHRIK